MIINLFYAAERDANIELYGTGGGWWYPNMVTAADAGLLGGTNVISGAAQSAVWSFGSGSYSPNAAMNRYDMAQVIFNLAGRQEWDVSPGADALRLPDDAEIPANYRAAVNFCYNTGFITGVDANGTFAGASPMTRGAAAVVICRLFDTKQAGGTAPRTVDKYALDGIALSAAITEVSEILGAPKATYDYDNGTSAINVYHDGGYNSFFLVGYVGGTVKYVYSAGRTHTIDGSSATARRTEYTDSNNANAVYAVSIAENSFAARCTNEVSSEKLVFELTNAFRVSSGVSALSWDDALGRAAHDHTQNMFDYNRLTHEGLGTSAGLNFSARAKAAGYTDFAAGENCSMGHFTPFGFVNSWVNSAGHRSNMLNAQHQHMGAGVVGNYSTQVFGYRLDW